MVLLDSKRTKTRSRVLRMDVDAFENQYRCDWCGYEFLFVARKVEGRSGGKHKGGSSVVVCPRCHRFIKTWE